MLAPVILVGQAPGPTEYKTGKPFSGQAGERIRQLFADAGLPKTEFDRTVYQTSAVKCFPGQKRNMHAWEDRVPCAAMRDACSGFLAQQIELVQPSLIVAMGGFASAVLDRLRGISGRPIAAVVGTLEVWGPIRLVYLAHTSPRNRWHNDPANREKQKAAMAILRTEIATLRATSRQEAR
jgi:uracil-DNA glycosylase family 4